MQLEPRPGLAPFGDLDSRCQPTAMVASGTVPGDQGCHQSIGQAALGRFVGPGHLGDHLATGQRVALARIESTRLGTPVTAAGRGGRGVVVGHSATHVDDRQLPEFSTRVLGQQLAEYRLGCQTLAECLQGLRTPGRVVVVLSAEGSDISLYVGHNLADGRVLAGHRRSAFPRLGIDRHDREGRGDRAGRGFLPLGRLGRGRTGQRCRDDHQ